MQCSRPYRSENPSSPNRKAISVQVVFDKVLSATTLRLPSVIPDQNCGGAERFGHQAKFRILRVFYALFGANTSIQRDWRKAGRYLVGDRSVHWDESPAYKSCRSTVRSGGQSPSHPRDLDGGLSCHDPTFDLPRSPRFSCHTPFSTSGFRGDALFFLDLQQIKLINLRPKATW